ncbi:MAG: GNAT family N-acetyltransferase [Chloroflexota bacterium]|nr:GNAT family N-acetyltransferase [Chloroflexota bacterium]
MAWFIMMTDLLVRLYDLENDWTFIADQARLGHIIRKPIGPEKQLIVDWVRAKFSDGWASETDIALANFPLSCFIAQKQGVLLGFACYDATALGYFGPIGVDDSYRNLGIGKALLVACMLDMKLKGYGYAIIGSAGPTEFYSSTLNVIEIPDSTPGLWKYWLKR